MAEGGARAMGEAVAEDLRGQARAGGDMSGFMTTCFSFVRGAVLVLVSLMMTSI
jgi:hypothetical protein